MPTPTKLAALKAHLSQYHPNITLLTPDDATFDDVRSCFVARPATPSAIARPQTAHDVQALVRFCVANDVEFVVRTGGHDCAGRSQVDGVLMVDMRDIKYVEVDASGGKTARVGGGVLLGYLAERLGEFGLVTPWLVAVFFSFICLSFAYMLYWGEAVANLRAFVSSGTVASVGYVGWATLGGYGPFSSLYGPGVDQIVAAKLVNAKGELVDANDEMLKGIRGGGGCMGVIVELTVKVFPLKEILTSMLVYDPSNVQTAWQDFTEGYQKLKDDGTLPQALYLQAIGLELPQVGKTLAVAATWIDADQEEGRKWIDKLAALGPCIMKTDPQPGTLAAYAEANEKMMGWGCRGRVHSVNLKRWTQKTSEIFAKHTLVVPGGGVMVSVHTLRCPPSSDESMFGTRADHLMVEMVGVSADAALEGRGREWAERFKRDLLESDADNVMEGGYISVLDDEDFDLRTVYGGYYDTLLGLKRKYDPGNVLKHTIPRLPVS